KELVLVSALRAKMREPLRVVERRQLNEVRDRIQVGGEGFRSEAFRFEWQGTTARERVERLRGVDDAVLLENRAQAVNLLLRFLAELPVEVVSNQLVEGLPLLLVARCRQQRRHRCGARSSQR